jgi:hypothetical protein
MRPQKHNKDFEEDPSHSPEYSMHHAMDDSCVLFTVNEHQSDPRIREHLPSDGGSSPASTQKLISPAIIKNMHDPQHWITTIQSPEMIAQLNSKLTLLLQKNEEQDSESSESINTPPPVLGTQEVRSTDQQFVMITRTHEPRMTPVLKAPQVSRCPSKPNLLQVFNLANQEHVSQLCLRLEQMQIDEETRQPRVFQRIDRH